MKDDINLYLPWPPTVNSYYGTARSGVKYITKKGRVFRELVEEALHEQVPGITVDEHIFLDVVLYPPDKRTRDLDNYMKALLDACTIGRLWEDDSLIDQLHIYRGEVISGGQVKISIAEAGPILKFG